MPSPWSPEQYHRFYAQRRQPFLDLMGMVQPADGMRVIDLGCGTGALTRQLHEHLGAAETLGVDSSETMLAQSAEHAGEALRFEQHDIARYTSEAPFDLVFSNAALQWILDHPALWAHVFELVAPGGQLAIQVPFNDDHPTHRSAAEVALTEPFKTALGGWTRPWPVLPVEEYALLLDRLGAVEQSVRLQVYVHHLPSREALVEWVKGSLLTAYQRRMPAELFEDYLTAYREALFAKVSDDAPYVYPFKRVLMWARRGG